MHIQKFYSRSILTEILFNAKLTAYSIQSLDHKNFNIKFFILGTVLQKQRNI